MNVEIPDVSVCVYTDFKESAGTDGEVQIKLIGSKGHSHDLPLDISSFPANTRKCTTVTVNRDLGEVGSHV